MSTVQKKSMSLGEEKVTYPKFHSQQEIHTTSSFLSLSAMLFPYQVQG